MTLKKKSVLLVNPWIYDFAAYDFGARPLGLLRIASFLRREYDVSLIDCLSGSSRSKRESGFSKFRKVRIETPAVLSSIKRPYFRYGISPEEFRDRLSRPMRPTSIYVTSGMTYWYPGVVQTIKILKEFFPKAPVILGGIYATLCHEHAARSSGADYVWRGDYIKNTLKEDFPAYDLLENKDVLPVQMTRG